MFAAGDEQLTQYRNIDNILKDSTECEPFIQSKQGTNWSCIPDVSDKVSLKTDRETIMAEVTSVSYDNEVFRGKVTHGYYPKDEGKWVDVGALVEFSHKKIAGIHKKQK
jgi:hypothetical protein